MIYNLIMDNDILAHSTLSDVNDEISSIRKAIISENATYEYKDRELLIRVLA